VATRVIEQAFAEGVARTKKTTPAAVGAYVRAKAWQPRYLPFEKVIPS
jgi:malate dehydrogenase (oxaloacetate-decarboxylating)